MMLRAVVLSLALATPAVAQDAMMLGIQLRHLGAADNSILQGAYAACILGKGDVEATAAHFTENGWTRSDDSEMGITFFAGPQEMVFVTLYDGGKICSVTSEVSGTSVAEGALVPTISLAGWPVASVEGADGCNAYKLGDLGIATITSSGQDPVCLADDSSDVRFSFGP